MAIDKKAFYEKHVMVAIEQQIKYGIPASVTLAQMGFESSFGTSRLARNDSNFFGVKKGSSWNGPVSYHVDDHNYPEAFRVYQDVRASVEDHSKVLMLQRYQKFCPTQNPLDYRGWVDGLCKGGYASSPSYKGDLIGEIEHYHLDKYDKMALDYAQKMGKTIGYAKNQSNHLPRQPTICALPINFQGLKVTGMFRENRGDHLHGGIDIATGGKNLPVYATENNGKVVAACKGENTGNMVKIEYTKEDGCKLQCVYMHLSQLNVKKNDIVQAGQQIGVSGNTGRSSGPHLHFETKLLNSGGKWEGFDPREYLGAIEGESGISIPLMKDGKDILAEHRTQYTKPAGNQHQVDMNQQLLAQITHSNDPTKWLSCLKDLNGDANDGRDAFTELISTLFSAALTIAAKIQISEAVTASNRSLDAENSQDQKEDEQNVVKRGREKVDASKLQLQASTYFETECPEEKQTQSLKQA